MLAPPPLPPALVDHAPGPLLTLDLLDAMRAALTRGERVWAGSLDLGRSHGEASLAEDGFAWRGIRYPWPGPLRPRTLYAFDGEAFALMARAGQAAWRSVLRHWPRAHRLVVACGPGNNGGDGYVLARHALEAGRSVRVIVLSEPATALARNARDAFVAAGGVVARGDAALGEADLIPRLTSL